MRRLRAQKDRGAAIVMVAISMVVLVGFTALAVDVGMMWSDRKQLQNGADAGALALAQSCANAMDAEVNCGNSATFREGLEPLADPYAPDNKIDTNADVQDVAWDPSAGTVTVTTVSTRDFLFAPVLGIQSADIPASATATWKLKSGGQFLPLTFSKCAFEASVGSATEGLPDDGTGSPVTLFLKSDPSNAGGSTDTSDEPTTETPASDCPDPDGATNGVPGGFGWLDVDSTGECLTATAVGALVESAPGGSLNCFDPATLRGPDDQGAIVEVPIFDTCTWNEEQSTTSCDGGAGGEYHIHALAAFHVTAYCLPADSATTGPNNQWWAADGSNEACTATATLNSGNGHRLIGYFLGYAGVGDGQTSTPPPPNYGLGIVKLVG